MIRSPLRLVAALALVALTLFVVACGGDDASDSGSTDKASNGSPTEGKKGGKLTQLGASDVDFLDPGETYYTAGYPGDLRDPDAALRAQARRGRGRSPASLTASRRSPTTRRPSR